jgi:hypothetical protein
MFYACVNIDSVWVGEWIYWPVIHITQNYTLYKSLQHLLSFFPACSVFNSHSLTKASNSGESSASCAQVVTVQWISCNRTLLNCQYNYNATSSQIPLHSLTELPTLNWLLNQIKWNLFFDWWFTANQSVLASSSLTQPQIFFQLNPCGHSPYVTFSLMRKWVWPFFEHAYHTYSMLLKILPFALYTSTLSVQASQSRSCLSYISYATTAA